MFEIKKFENTSLNCAIGIVIVDGAYWFRGKHVATALGYHDTTCAIKDHVDEEDKTKLEKLRPGEKPRLTSCKSSFNEKNAMYINESGLYSLILKGK